MRTFSITDVGMVRQVNQDYVYVTDRPLGILQNLFVVADGMGGHQAGDYASKYTVEVLNRELALSEGEDIERCLVGAIKTANREIIKEASRDEHLQRNGNDGCCGDDLKSDDVFRECRRQPFVFDQSGHSAAYERSFPGRRDGKAWRDKTGRSKTSSG